VLGHRLADGVQRFGHGRVDEAAGVDHHHVGIVVGLDDVVALDLELGEDSFGVDQGLGAAEADETDAGVAGGGGWRGHAALRDVKAGDYSGGARIGPEHAMEAAGMGEQVEIEVPGSGRVGGWLARPGGAPRGALVVIQEIFGVNAHMRAVADGYAGEGYLALAPALFDPVERDVELGYDEDGFKHGRGLVQALGAERALAIVEAAAARLRAELGDASDDGARIGAVGFCWGGTLALLANTRLGMPAVSYYGARNVQYLDEPLRAPMMFHFGGQDTSIDAEAIELHRRKLADAAVYVYPDAGHAFNRDVDPNAFEPASARLA